MFNIALCDMTVIMMRCAIRILLRGNVYVETSYSIIIDYGIFDRLC